MKTGYPSIDKTHLQGIPEEKLHPEILPVSMFATFLKVNGEHLDEVAIETAGRTYTKQDLRSDVICTAGAFLSMGLTDNSKIALVAPNCYEGIVSTFAANAVGIQVAMFELFDEANPKPFLDELDNHNPDLVIFYDTSARWAMDYLRTQKILVINPPDGITEKLYGFNNALRHLTVTLEEITAEIEKHSITPEDKPMVFLKTSGSTSKPKTLPFSNRAIFAALIYAANSTGTSTRDESVTRALCHAPYQHGYGWMPLFVNIMGGNPVILAGSSVEDVAKYYKLKPSYIYGTPLNLKQFMEHTPEDADISMLTAFFCAGAAISEEDYQEGINYFRSHNCQAEIRNNYGISEGLCIGTTSDHVPHKEGTIGKFYVGPEWLLVDENGTEVKYGEPGEAIVAADSLCQGYYHDPEATAKSFIKRDGKTFFKTGDFLTLYGDGYVSFVGRKARFFFATGVTDKVNCETIEQAISSLDVVDQTAVVVTPDNAGAKAFAVLENGIQPGPETRQHILESLSTQLKPYQMPRAIVFVDELPLMESGKVDYKLLETM